MSAPNIKGAPPAFTPDLVADFVGWLDRAIPPCINGVDQSRKGDRHAVVTMDSGRIVSVEERHG